MTGESPAAFQVAVERALGYARASAVPAADRLVFLASLNEWSEGHYLEPDTRFGLGWLEAVRAARSTITP